MNSHISPDEFYDNLASSYDALLKDSKYNVQHIYEGAKIFQKYNTNITGNILGKILDIGCGTGFLKDLLGGNFEYTGIDISQNMLNYASQRGYKTIHQPIAAALPEIPNHSYDFVFALGSLLFVENIHSTLTNIERIARKSILLSLDLVSEDYKKEVVVPVYNHSEISIPNAKEDYFIEGWISPTTGIAVKTRMIYIEKV